jgi:ubiquinone/menaquinone biosynthesis C-methylase UbiE
MDMLPSQHSCFSFDVLADRYDDWYESDEGSAIFREELACLRTACPRYLGRWLEVGVGTGRFASELGIAEGIDPSPKMLEYAARRSVRTYTGSAEHLPFPDGSFDGVLMALALCFVQDAKQALRESARVLHPSGTLLVGIVPMQSPWGRLYAQKAVEGHPVYSLATFRTVSETLSLAEETGFVLRESASTLCWNPGDTPTSEPRVERRASENAGCAALRFENGGMSIPDAPGLGVDIVPEAIEKYPYERRELRHFRGDLTDIRLPDAEDYA